MTAPGMVEWNEKQSELHQDSAIGPKQPSGAFASRQPNSSCTYLHVIFTVINNSKNASLSCPVFHKPPSAFHRGRLFTVLKQFRELRLVVSCSQSRIQGIPFIVIQKIGVLLFCNNGEDGGTPESFSEFASEQATKSCKPSGGNQGNYIRYPDKLATVLISNTCVCVRVCVRIYVCAIRRTSRKVGANFSKLF